MTDVIIFSTYVYFYSLNQEAILFWDRIIALDW